MASMIESEAATVSPKCVLCLTPNSGKVIIFKESTLAKCHEIFKARSGSKSKWSDVKLPSVVDSLNGYHSTCYRTYTAYSCPKPETSFSQEVEQSEDGLSGASPEANAEVSIESETHPQQLGRSTRSRTADAAVMKSRSRTGILDKVCLFCEKETKYHDRKKQELIQCLTTIIQKSVNSDASILKDAKMLGKISGLDLVAKEAHYHKICRMAYHNQAEKLRKEKRTKIRGIWHELRSIHDEAFNCTTSSVEEFIMNGDHVLKLNDLHRQYISCLVESGSQTECAGFLPHHLERKIVKHFEDRITIAQHPKGKIIFNSSIPLEDALQKADEDDINIHTKTQEAALLLRRICQSAPHNPLPEKLTVEDIKKGTVVIPDVLTAFFTTLINGPNKKKIPSTSKKNRIEALSSDTVYSVTCGRLKPAKHLLLGMTMKTITGSRRVVEILNRFGHGPSYSTLEEIETELSFTAAESRRLLPHGLVPNKPNYHTGVAFDNYDCFVETLSGKDTLHDTVGLCYQDKFDDSHSAEVADSSSSVADIHDTIDQQDQVINHQSGGGKKRRRAFESSGLDVQPYYRKPRMIIDTIASLDDPRRAFVPPSLLKSDQMDRIWIASKALFGEKVSMWMGWNVKFAKNENLPMQQICYLPQINQSPTSNAVVAKTMEMANQIAEECNQKYISVTYDLAIARLAFAIQREERPKFDRLFIQLGSFHIELSFFKAIGKYIAESGGPSILTETGIIAQGSLLSFLNGKHYNRCKRIHPLFAAALQCLHFDVFLETIDQELVEEASNILDSINQSPETYSDLESEPAALTRLFDVYKDYSEKTVRGEHGPTAQYWMIYIQFIQLYHTFVRAVRTGDHLLYIYTLPSIIRIFFAFNHQNYSRWLTLFHENLLNMEETHPGISQDFLEGILSIRRTEKPFSRIPIDLTLEQTINADAANSSSGIAAFTNSTSARQRWATSHYMRTAILSHLLDKLGLSKKEELSKELHPNRMRQDQQQLSSIIEFINGCIHPFKVEEARLLVNIVTGKRASPETTRFLLNVNETGKQSYENFIERCHADPAAFNQRITKQKIHTFASEGLKAKTRVAGKVKEIRMERDLMGKLLGIALENKVDMELVLSYPLTPVPLCFGQLDGSLNKTNKAVLFSALEGKIQSRPPSNIDVYILDGFFFLHLLKDLPQMWGKLAREVLIKICQYRAKRIDVVFDRVTSPSIKDVERDRRSDSDRNSTFKISGPNQRRTDDFIKSLRNDEFKKEVVRFLVSSWSDDSVASIIGEKVLYVTQENLSYRFEASNKSVSVTEVENLRSSHEEADTRMVAHLAHIPAPATVVIRTADSDVLTVAVGNIPQVNSQLHTFLEVGLTSKNSLRFIDVTALAKKLGPKLARALPGFHAFTGCDYTPAFARKGKKKPFDLLVNSESYCEAFATLGSTSMLPDSVFDVLQEFVCRMYGYKNVSFLNEVRLLTFSKTYKPKSRNPMASIKGIDGSALPPCESVLVQQILRCNSICSVWNNATQLNPQAFPPEKNGWELVDNKFSIKWFDGDISPSKLEDFVLIEEAKLTDAVETEENDHPSDDEFSAQESDDDFSTDEEE